MGFDSYLRIIDNSSKLMEVKLGILEEIQRELLESNKKIGPILLKFRFLASRLGSGVLEQWIKNESEGYPSGADLPDYRNLGISYTANFSGPYGSGIKNAPIPPYLIEKYCGKSWNSYAIRQSISSIDDLIESADEGVLRLNCSNLILLLQGNVYDNMACNSVIGLISKASLSEIQNAVRTRLLEVTLELEKKIPNANEIKIGSGEIKEALPRESISQITNNIIYGHQTNLSNNGDSNVINLSICEGSKTDVASELEKAGINSQDAKEFTEILSSEKSGSLAEPFGVKAKTWVAENIGKAANGTWKAGISVATSVLTEAALKFYGLK